MKTSFDYYRDRMADFWADFADDGSTPTERLRKSMNRDAGGTAAAASALLGHLSAQEVSDIIDRLGRTDGPAAELVAALLAAMGSGVVPAEAVARLIDGLSPAARNELARVVEARAGR